MGLPQPDQEEPDPVPEGLPQPDQEEPDPAPEGFPHAPDLQERVSAPYASAKSSREEVWAPPERQPLEPAPNVAPREPAPLVVAPQAVVANPKRKRLPSSITVRTLNYFQDCW